jgi:NCS1 family nucleobase:cation symporter-1
MEDSKTGGELKRVESELELGMERHASDPIPESERTHDVRSLLTLWFSSNMQLTPILTGGFAIYLGLSVPWAALSVVVGTLLGTILMAYHSAQGPKLGVPQMIQSRAQFGYIGATLPLAIVLVIFMGYLSLTGVLGADAFAAWTHGSVTVGLLLISIVCMVLALYGYKWIHRYERWMSGVFLIAFIYMTVRLLTKYPLGHVISHSPGGYSNGAFFLSVAAISSYVVTWAPYVSDYSRYLPSDTSMTKTVVYTYVGAAVSSIWMELIGVVAGAVALTAFNANPSGFLARLSGPGLTGVMFAVLILGVIAANIMNLYSAYMTTTTGLDWIISRRLQTRPVVRVWSLLILAAIGFFFGVLAEGHFYESLSNFLLLLLYAIIPWTAINLVDFYFIRHGEYDVSQMYKISGKYGLFQWKAIIVFLVGVLIEVPFMNTTLYEGPIAKAWGGADVAWFVGFFVSAVAYYLWARSEATETAVQLVGDKGLAATVTPSKESGA